MAKNIRGLLNATTSLIDWASHAHTAATLIGALRGKDLPADAPKVSQGFVGIFGKGDERTLQLMLKKLTPAERQELTGFLNWHFSGQAWQDKLLVMWYSSAFRVFVTGIKSGGPTGTRTEEAVTTSGDTKTTTKTEHQLHNESYDDACDFLRLIVKLIRSGRSAHKREQPTSTTEEQTLAGYRKALSYFAATGVPHLPPVTTQDWGDWAKALGLQSWAHVQTWYLASQTAIQDTHTRVLETEQREGRVKRWLRKTFC